MNDNEIIQKLGNEIPKHLDCALDCLSETSEEVRANEGVLKAKESIEAAQACLEDTLLNEFCKRFGKDTITELENFLQDKLIETSLLEKKMRVAIVINLIFVILWVIYFISRLFFK